MLKPELGIILPKSGETADLVDRVFLIEEVECEDIALEFCLYFFSLKA